MNYKTKIDKNIYGYYIMLQNLNFWEPDPEIDSDIAAALNLTLNYYQTCLVNDYNGVIVEQHNSKDVYFKTEQDVNDTNKWIETIIIAAKLSE